MLLVDLHEFYFHLNVLDVFQIPISRLHFGIGASHALINTEFFISICIRENEASLAVLPDLLMELDSMSEVRETVIPIILTFQS